LLVDGAPDKGAAVARAVEHSAGDCAGCTTHGGVIGVVDRAGQLEEAGS
jgi:hypothetical protein